MRRILFAVLGLVATTVSAKFGECQKGCAIELGKCIVDTLDLKTCLKTSAMCAVECTKEITVEHAHKHHDMSPKAQSDMGKCQKNCGIDYAKCLVTTFDLKECTKQQAGCALDCLKGLKVEKKPVPAPIKVQDIGTCQKNCAIDYGKCLVTTFDVKGCTQQQAGCAIECLKELKVMKAVEVKSDVGVCQKNCAIDFSKCLITTFDMASCLKQEASCALDCLKSIKVEHHHHNEPVKSLKCSACKFAAGKIEGVINKFGCGLADVGITAACETVFLGPEDPLADICAAGFIAACPTLLHWIEQKAYNTDKACKLIKMC